MSTSGHEKLEGLCYKRKVVWDYVNEEEKSQVGDFADKYKSFLDRAKTEREAVEAILDYARARGFFYLTDKDKLVPGDRFLAVNRHKEIVMGVIGTGHCEAGLNIVGAHIDSPRLDLKPLPLYEDEGLVWLKTHYYGGVKKYQWLAIPLSLHGTVVKNDGEVVLVSIGEKVDEPVFTVADLLPHLAKDQMEKKMADAVPGESMNILVGGTPLPAKDLQVRFKKAVLGRLFREYGITEEDLISSELELVPAWPARDIGLDRSFVGAYGQDDRVCAYAALCAVSEITMPERTIMALFVDKEEIGSTGNTGMQAAFFANTVAEAVSRCTGGYSELLLRRVLANSRALSADVNVGLDPNYADVTEKVNTARLGCGVVLTKYTGSKGKYASSDAHAEFVGQARRIFNDAGVIWQTGELGKVDQGGGGTIAYLLAAYGMDVIDCGVPLLGMHSPFEVASKADIYMAYRAYKVFLES